MKVLYISTFVNKTTLSSLEETVRGEITVSANKYSELIRKGLEADQRIDLKCIFTPSIGDYSITKIGYYYPKKDRNDPVGIYLSCINIVVLKQLIITLKIFFYTLHWFIANFFVKEKIVMFSSIQLPFLIAVLPFKMFRLKIVSFVPDLPNFQYNYTTIDGNIKKFILPLYIVLCNFLYHIISYFVYITKHMVVKFPKRPYMIMEGLVEKRISKNIVHKLPVFSVMYAGALYETMGIKKLLEAIELMEYNAAIVFYFFGKGDMTSLIQEKSKTDKRIVYGGVVPNEEILLFEKKVNLLINPRPTNQKYTKYSFPSKLMEYMLSGTPILTTKLAGIPECYYDKMYFIDDETSIGMKGAIEACMNKPRTELMQFGEVAKEYVLSNKNYIHQIVKVILDVNEKLFSR